MVSTGHGKLTLKRQKDVMSVEEKAATQMPSDEIKPRVQRS